ncbi:hypothetical protein [Flavobacterium sp.]|uniref:hypothetical protein n=1 Tax=Flavobacterium sp. TaxID=239 RepID=UPI00260E50BD|nr:hypothetical protein [Flavobacterium sp.]
MKDLLKFSVFIFLYFSTANSQEVKSISYASQGEKIVLRSDGTFQYTQRAHLLHFSAEGNWQIRQDTILVLDSRPQQSKMLVFPEFKKRMGKKKRFVVRGIDDNHSLHYHLYLITKSNDTIEYKNQFDSSVIEADVQAFYFYNTNGVRSPTYDLNQSRLNYFEVILNANRVFENEYWKYHEDYLVPITRLGEIAKYILPRIDD